VCSSGTAILAPSFSSPSRRPSRADALRELSSRFHWSRLSKTTGSGSVSGYEIDFDGTLALLDPNGRTGLTGEGSTPIDLVITGNGRFLYTLNGGTRTIGVFRIDNDGSLGRRSFVGGLPAGANGLAAR
jgi:hypothetical protein